MNRKEGPFTIKNIEDNSGFLLWQVTHIWQQQQKKALEINYGISQSQYVILATTYWLTLEESEVTQITLSQHTKIEPMTVSQLLKVLQKKNYIYRKPHSVDTRAKAVYLTKEGEDLMSRAVETIETIDKLFFKSLSISAKKFNSELARIINANSLVPKKRI